MATISDIKITSHADEAIKAKDEAVARALEKMGLVAERYAKEYAPVDTGRLRNSITHEAAPDEGAVYIGTNVEYAPYVELGTSRQTAQPYLRPAATDHVDEYTDIVKRVLKGEF
jgi:HK97 gp10 family phage protein